MRTVLLYLFLVACAHHAPPVTTPAPVPPPRNFVCERIEAMKKLGTVDTKAECTAEYTDAGEQRAHSARVTIDKAIFGCAINAATLSVVCDDKLLVMVPPPEPPKPEPAPEAKPDTKVVKPKSGKR